MIRYLVPLFPLALIAPAAQAQTWEPPEGCTGFLTVQQRGCVVSNHYTCEDDPEGHQWRADFTQEGPVFASQINEETEWVESLSLVTRIRRVMQEAPDPASLSELLETGVDTYDFTTVSDAGEETRWRGADQLTGETLEIGDHELPVVTYTLEQYVDGEPVAASRGTNFVSEEWRLFLPGVSETVTADGLEATTDNTPVELIEPGEPGFFASRPIYDCNVEEARFTR